MTPDLLRPRRSSPCETPCRLLGCTGVSIARNDETQICGLPRLSVSPPISLLSTLVCAVAAGTGCPRGRNERCERCDGCGLSWLAVAPLILVANGISLALVCQGTGVGPVVSCCSRALE